MAGVEVGAVAVVAWVLTALGACSLCLMLYTWRRPVEASRAGLADGDVDSRFSFSLIVPARHEQDVLVETLERLVAQTHPRYEIVVVVGDDDPVTHRVALEVACRHRERIRVVVDGSRAKNKPRALNRGLAECRNEIVGVFDAEDEVHPDLLRRIDLQFQVTRAQAVQAGVQLMDFWSGWYSVRNVLEYWFWFHSRLHFHAQQRFIPLGGNTVFVRADTLRALGGWDPDCLAEDCELGVRLSARGARISVAYEPALATREETPPTYRAFLHQRIRWDQGYLQTYRKGEWRRLRRRGQRQLARFTLAMPFLQAAAGALAPFAAVSVVALKVPTAVALLSFLPLLVMAVTVAVEVTGLSEFCRTYGTRARARDYLRLVLGTLPFHFTLAFAAFAAVTREVRGVRNWRKTAHIGAHRVVREPELQPA